MMLSTKNIPFCNRRGVSLIELVVVVAIVGIIAAIGTPEYGRFVAKNRASNAANDLVQEMRLARTVAVKENREYLIVFDPDPDGVLATNDGRYLIGFDGDGDNSLGNDFRDGYGICGCTDQDGDGSITGNERIPEFAADNPDNNGDGIPDCIKIVNLSDYGSDLVFGYDAAGSTMPPDPPDPINDPAITVDGVDFPGNAAVDNNTAFFNRDGSLDSLGYVYFQHLSRGYSFVVTMVSFAGGTDVWRWDGDIENPTVTAWVEVR